MTNLTKPVLYNGFKVGENLTVKNRIEKIFFTEIYELSDKKYLYLFVNLNPNDVVDRSEKYDILRIKNETESYIGVIVDSHSKNQVFAIREDLTVLKGFECVAGMKDLKNLLTSDVINPLKNPEKFKKFKVSVPNGIILYGPPGCGKTFIIRKLAEELAYNFFEVKHSDLATPYIHGSVSNIGKVFSIAKQNAPAVVFFDEISGLVPDRKYLQESSSHKEEEIDEFIMQLNDAADNHILVVGATNYIERIDTAILRPGRFDKKIYVSPPDFEARVSLFKVGLANRPHDKNMNFEHLASLTTGFSCADIIDDLVESGARVAANLDRALIDQNLLEEQITRIIHSKKDIGDNDNNRPDFIK
jgi:ATP-dependent 26S proteasome regulatory subunit